MDRATQEARLVLADGSEYRGRVFGAATPSSGEVVFATGMVGYPESLTDPSFRDQILVLTYPLIGNYGVPAPGDLQSLEHRFESDRIHVRGLVVSSLSDDSTHWEAGRSLHEWLASEGIVGIEGVDTRAITKRLREGGVVPGKILIEGGDADPIQESTFDDYASRNLVADVSCKEPILYGNGSKRVILVDCGAKMNIARSLVKRGVSVLRVPWDHDFAAEEGDGILISNGPGDPVRATTTIETLRRCFKDTRPVFGICLGNQLVGLAAGCRTYKLKFGHRSQNQPCRQVGTNRCFITSQNHGYAIDGNSLPAGWEEWFVNANDGTNEGIRHSEKPFWTVQFHPEANPGPQDTAFLFDQFVERLG